MEIGKKIALRFENKDFNKVFTIEYSGMVPALGSLYT